MRITKFVYVLCVLFLFSKIFVGGLSWSTTDETFKKHFEEYGEIQDTKIMTNQLGQPRGFGFVTFKDPASVKKVLQEKHYIDEKLVGTASHVRGTSGHSMS